MLHLKHSQVVPRFFFKWWARCWQFKSDSVDGIDGFLMVSRLRFAVTRHQPGNRRVGNLAAVRLLWSIIFQRRVEHSCGQTSRRNTWDRHSNPVVSGFLWPYLWSVDTPLVQAIGNPLAYAVGTYWFVFLSNATCWAAQTVLCLSVDGNRNYLLPTSNDDVDWKP